MSGGLIIEICTFGLATPHINHVTRGLQIALRRRELRVGQRCNEPPICMPRGTGEMSPTFTETQLLLVLPEDGSLAVDSWNPSSAVLTIQLRALQSTVP